MSHPFNILYGCHTTHYFYSNHFGTCILLVCMCLWICSVLLVYHFFHDHTSLRFPIELTNTLYEILIIRLSGARNLGGFITDEESKCDFLEERKNTLEWNITKICMKVMPWLSLKFGRSGYFDNASQIIEDTRSWV